MIRFLFLCAFVFPSLWFKVAVAEPLTLEQINNKELHVTLDGIAYSYEEIAEAFVQSSVSIRSGKTQTFYGHIPYLSFEQSYDRLISPNIPFRTDYNEFEQDYQWLIKLLDTQETAAKSHVFNKWRTPVKIALSMPYNFQRQANSEYHENATKVSLSAGEALSNKQVSLATVTKTIEQLTPQLEEATNHKVSFIYSETPLSEETPANMRVVLVKSKHWRTPFKKDVVLVSGSGRGTIIDFRTDIEKFLINAFHFTPTSQPISAPLDQVDGFFVTNDKNEIIFSVCFILDSTEPDMLERLTQECLLRSFGLPNHQMVTANSYLSLWNTRDITYLNSDKEVDQTPLKYKHAKSIELEANQINEFDTHMLKMLYQSDIQAGMEAHHLIQP
ncbi:MAG TPA: hypothetical protein EYG18_05175 [Micavibrio sp.]|nr:hypothetical protein [Micavibrio sp.]HIL28641.1 hypothetical protein [Micavibrio sp.]